MNENQINNEIINFNINNEMVSNNHVFNYRLECGFVRVFNEGTEFVDVYNRANHNLDKTCFRYFTGIVQMDNANNAAILDNGSILYDSKAFGSAWKLVAKCFEMTQTEYVEVGIEASHGFELYSFLRNDEPQLFVKRCNASGSYSNCYGTGVDRGSVVKYGDDGKICAGRLSYNNHKEYVTKTLHNLKFVEDFCGGSLPNMPFFDETSDVLALDHEGVVLFFASEKLMDEDPTNLQVVHVDSQFKRISSGTIFRGIPMKSGWEYKTLNLSITIDGYNSDESPLEAGLMEDKFGNDLDHNGEVKPFFAKYRITHKNSLLPPTHRKAIKYRRGCEFKYQTCRYEVKRK